MTIAPEVFDALADLVTYPDASFITKCPEKARIVVAEFPDLATDLECFLRFVSEQPADKLEEIYTRTFDGSPTNSLELGWHLFGENYTRGAFLVHMRQEMRDLGLEESRELPDHLTHGLAVLGRLSEREASELAADSILPAVQTIRKALAREGNVYHGVLEAIEKSVESRILPGHPRREHPLGPTQPPLLAGGEWKMGPEFNPAESCSAFPPRESASSETGEDCREICPLPDLFPGACR